MKKFLANRKATAEVIGTIMLVMILLFFFTNVYVFHDLAVRQSNDLSLKKLNAGMNVEYVTDDNDKIIGIKVTATASEVTLCRLWIDTDSSHVPFDLSIRLEPGTVNAVTLILDSKGHGYENEYLIGYTPASPFKFTLLNTLGVQVSENSS
jgi:hypothetical protein